MTGLAASALRSTVRPLAAIAVAAAVMAVGARLLLVRADGGLLSTGNYDDSVYFGSAIALVHGRLPYRDFLFLQPPGITLVLTPFAALGRLVGDAPAWALARAAFVVAGGAGAALSAGALRRFGLVAAAVGSGFLALSFPVMYADRSTLVECAGDTALLAALALLGGAPLRAATPRLAAAAGAALGLAAATKIFYVVPLVLLAVLLGRRALPFVIGAAAALIAVLLPFFLVDPAAMWRQVVEDQVGRPRNGVPLTRWTELLQPPTLPHVPPVVVLGVLTAGAVAVLILALRRAGSRPFAVLAIGGVLTLLAAPSFYRHYAVLAVVPFALALGAVLGPALTRLAAVRSGRVAAVAAGAALTAITVGGWQGSGIVAVSGVREPPGLAASLSSVRGCVATLSPALLILADDESRQFEEGCAVRVDPTGEIYDRDRDGAGGAWANSAWQSDVTAYLTSGEAVLLWNDGRWLDPADQARVTAGRTEYARRGFVLDGTRGRS